MQSSTANGFVRELYIAGAMGKEMQSVTYAQAIANRGLVGDRYYLEQGYYSNHPQWGANVTLIQTEAIEAVNKGHEEHFCGAQMRRNLVTSGVNLDELIGVPFRCGTAVLRGTKAYPPCLRLARLIKSDKVVKYFAYCAGIGAAVIADGEIRPNDEICILDEL